MRIYFIVAHVDDAELAAGGSISKFVSQGHDVTIFTMTRKYGQVDLFGEFDASTTLLGVSGRCSDYPTRQLQSHASMIGDFIHVVMSSKPDVVFTHDESDRHPDHRTVAEQVRRIWSGTLITFLAPWNGSPDLNYFIPLEQAHMSMKKAALRKYVSQGERSYMDESFTEAEAKYNGIRAGTEYAEGFKIVKMVRSL